MPLVSNILLNKKPTIRSQLTSSVLKMMAPRMCPNASSKLEIELIKIVWLLRSHCILMPVNEAGR